MTQVTLTQTEINNGLRGGPTQNYALGASQFTYSIPNASSTWPAYFPGEEPFDGYSTLSAAQGTAFRAAMALWDSYIAPNFTEVTESAGVAGEIRVAFTNITEPDTLAYAYTGPPQSPGGLVGDIWIDNSEVGEDFSPGTFLFETLLHEIGHTLGFKHPFEAPTLPAAYDNTRFTVMAYDAPEDSEIVTFAPNGGGGLTASFDIVNAVTPMVLDIAVAQGLYGASTTTNAGDTVYTFTQGVAELRSIYDASGSDTIDLNNFTRNSIIDLNPGAYSSLGIWTTQEQTAFWQAQFPGFNSFIAAQFGPETFTFRDNLGIALSATIENGIGGSGADLLYGNAVANRLEGRSGDDYLDGRAGADTTIGGLGDDWHFVDSAGDVVTELAGEGNDRVLASAAYTLTAGASVETLTTIDAAGTAAIDLTGNALAQVIFGNAGANALAGGGGADTLIGLGGHDVLSGNVSGPVTMQGGTGDDWYNVRNLGDSVIELAGEGNDRVFASVNFILSAGRAVESLETDNQAGTTALTLTGNSLAQTIFGNAGANNLAGGGGADYLLGFGGADILFGNSDAASTLQGGTGDDWYYILLTGDSLVEFAGEGSDRILTSVSYTLSAGQEVETLGAADQAGTGAIDLGGNDFGQIMLGNQGANTLSGLGGADDLSGLGGNDILLGGDGADFLNGGAGSDVLNGGIGVDSFVFADALGGLNIDGIQDFLTGEDRLFLENAVFTGLSTGVLASGALVNGSAAQDADDRIIYNPATGVVLFDADGTGAAAAIHFATLAPGAALAATDIIVI